MQSPSVVQSFVAASAVDMGGRQRRPSMPLRRQVRAPLQVLLPPTWQQTWFIPPQVWHIPGPTPSSTQRKVALEQVWFLQQGWPLSPHLAHVPPIAFMAPVHSRPVWQFSPAQQAAPALAPQFMQVPKPGPGSLQPSPMVQVLPEQHVCPLPPQGWQMAAPPPTGSVQRLPV
jgi:hypothetical protein